MGAVGRGERTAAKFPYVSLVPRASTKDRRKPLPTARGSTPKHAYRQADCRARYWQAERSPSKQLNLPEALEEASTAALRPARHRVHYAIARAAEHLAVRPAKPWRMWSGLSAEVLCDWERKWCDRVSRGGAEAVRLAPQAAYQPQAGNGQTK